MVSLNVKIFVVLKILHSLITMQKLLFANNCWHNQITKKFPRDLTFIFTEHSENANSFL